MDQICQRTDCKGRRFKKLLDDKGVVSKAEPLQQCFYYRLGRFFDKSEADESAMQVFSGKRPCCGHSACACESVCGNACMMTPILYFHQFSNDVFCRMHTELMAVPIVIQNLNRKSNRCSVETMKIYGEG